MLQIAAAKLAQELPLVNTNHLPASLPTHFNLILHPPPLLRPPPQPLRLCIKKSFIITSQLSWEHCSEGLADPGLEQMPPYSHLHLISLPSRTGSWNLGRFRLRPPPASIVFLHIMEIKAELFYFQHSGSSSDTLCSWRAGIATQCWVLAWSSSQGARLPIPLTMAFSDSSSTTTSPVTREKQIGKINSHFSFLRC